MYLLLLLLIINLIYHSHFFPDNILFDHASDELSPELLALNLSEIYKNGSHQVEDFITSYVQENNTCIYNLLEIRAI